jgi:curved DNA-binding protein
MKYKDYYAILGVDRSADAKTIKDAYRKLARKYHPDVSKEAGAEERFKDIAEAYQTLKDPEARAAYDQLGMHRPGEDFEAPPDWTRRYGAEEFGFEDLDLADLFANLTGRGRYRQRRPPGPMPGQDFEVTAQITLEDAWNGALVDLDLSMPEYDEQGRLHRARRQFKARIPRGATDGQRLRLRGQGGKGYNGGPAGDLFLNIVLRPHPRYRVSGHDLYIDLPLAPWEAALGASIEVPTLGGPVRVKVPAGTNPGQQLRIAGRGLPMPRGGAGDLYAVAQVVVPSVLSERERALLNQLKEVSRFDPRAGFSKESGS